MGGRADGPGTPGTKLHDNPLYLGRMIVPYHLTLVMTVVGAARASLDEYDENIMKRSTYHPPFMPRFQHFDYQRAYGYAMTLTDSAEALLHSGGEKHMAHLRRWGDTGAPYTLEEQVRLLGVVQTAGRLACEAVEHLFHASSSASAKKGAKMERYFRDVAMYRGHTSSQYLSTASGTRPRTLRPAVRLGWVVDILIARGPTSYVGDGDDAAGGCANISVQLCRRR